GIFDEIRETKQLPLPEIQRFVPSLLEVAEQSDLFRLLSSLQAKDDYTYRHNIGVGVISAMLGKWLHLNEQDLSALTLAATLHDVGKMNIPLEIINKPGKLTDVEYKLMQKHTVFGFEMIQNTPGTSRDEALVALQHHEREDGSGYPHGIFGNRIHPLSKIVAVADVFHAMTSRRAYKAAAPFYAILREMDDGRFGEFDPKAISVFIEKMMQSLVGNYVRLTDLREGLIVMIHPHDPIRPLVQIDNQFIDLSRVRRIEIQQVLA